MQGDGRVVEYKLTMKVHVSRHEEVQQVLLKQHTMVTIHKETKGVKSVRKEERRGGRMDERKTKESTTHGARRSTNKIEKRTANKRQAQQKAQVL